MKLWISEELKCAKRRRDFAIEEIKRLEALIGE